MVQKAGIELGRREIKDIGHDAPVSCSASFLKDNKIYPLSLDIALTRDRDL
jgi:hypothetical protein